MAQINFPEARPLWWGEVTLLLENVGGCFPTLSFREVLPPGFPLSQHYSHWFRDYTMQPFNTSPPLGQTHSQYYRIEVRGHLDLSWSDWFEGLTLTHHPAGNTTISGQITDQATLYALLIKIRDLGLALVSVNPFDPNTA